MNLNLHFIFHICSTALYVLLTAFIISILSVLLVSTILFVTRPNVKGAKRDDNNEEIPLAFSEWLYFVITTFTTVGYGDMTLEHHGFASVLMFSLWCCAYWLVPLCNSAIDMGWDVLLMICMFPWSCFDFLRHIILRVCRLVF